jgi:spore germination protein KC
LLPLVTGCWDRLEIEERAVILGIGIDEAEPSEEKEEGEISHLRGSLPSPSGDMLKVTAQVAIPGRIPLGPGEGGGGSGAGQKPVWVLSVVGHTLEDAFNNLQQEIAAQLFFGHLRVIVVSKKLAQSNLSNISDNLRRNPDVRRTNWMVVSEGRAEDLMKMAPQLERVPTLYLLATMDRAVQMGKLPNAFVGTFWTADSALGIEPFLPYVKLVENGNMQISGLAFFSGQKMVGHSEPLEIGAYMGIKGLEPGGYSVLTKIPDTETNVTFQVTSRKARTDIAIKNGRPQFHIKLHNEGNLREKSNENAKLATKVITKIEDQLSEQADKAYIALIKKTQEKGSDIFGFGEYVRAKEPKYWNEHIKTKEKWRELYKDVDVKVESTFSVRRIGGKTE